MFKNLFVRGRTLLTSRITDDVQGMTRLGYAVIAISGVASFMAIDYRNQVKIDAINAHVEAGGSRPRPGPGPSAEEVERMLADLKTKTFAEKMTSVYDGAVNTHEIGFNDGEDGGSREQKELSQQEPP